MNSNPTSSRSEHKFKGPALIAVHSYSGKAMTDSEKKEFVEGALTTADETAATFPHEIIDEREWMD